jgi:hypothetical protein
MSQQPHVAAAGSRTEAPIGTRALATGDFPTQGAHMIAMQTQGFASESLA